MDKQFGSKADRIYCGPCYDAQFATRCDGCGDVFRAGTIMNHFVFLSQSIEKFQFKKKEFYKGGKRNGDQKSKQITITSGIVSQPSQQTTAAIAELIGRTYQGFWQFLESAGLTSKQAQRPKPVPEVLVWLVPRLNLFSFLFFIAEKVRLKDFLFLVPFFGK